MNRTMNRSIRSFVLAFTTACMTVCAPLAAQDAAPADAAQAADPALAPLAAHEVARVNGSAVPLSAFEQYVGSAEARGELGQAVIQGAHDAWLVEHAADSAGLTVTRALVDTMVARLEERAGASLAPFRGEPAFEERFRLLTQQVLLMERAGVDDPLDPAAQQAWLEARRAEEPLTRHPLSHDLAASWDGGELTRRELGEQILAQSVEEQRAALLSEFLGVLVLHAQAEKLGVELTAEAAAGELAEREALVAANPSTQGITYEQIIEQTRGISLEELVASPRFSAEVLLREMVDLNWDDAALAGFFEQERALFEERYGEGVGFDDVRHGVLQEVRRRSYQKLMSESRIVRRY